MNKTISNEATQTTDDAASKDAYVTSLSQSGAELFPSPLKPQLLS